MTSGTDSLKILHSPLEIAGQAALTALGQRRVGHRAVCFAEPHPFRYAVQPDFVPLGSSRRLWKLQRVAFALPALGWFDVFHYHNGSSLLPVAGYLDARVARRLGRKVVVEFWGGDVRRPEIEAATNPFYTPGPSEDGSALERIKRWMDVTEGHVICADHFADAHLAGLAEHIHIVGQRVDTTRLTPPDGLEQRTRPVVVHAPSHLAVKGTSFVRAAVDALKDRGRAFDYVELTGRTNAEVLAEVRAADIVVDQLCLGTHGILAAEAMAMGKPVICRISDDQRTHYPADLPIVSADPNSFTEVLEDLLSDPGRRRTLGQAGRTYAVREHDVEVVAARLNVVYEQLPQR
jgi:glycosyltransferase involved in cell wall biosynthesis